MTIFDGVADFSIGFVVSFVVLSLISLLCFVKTVMIAYAKNHYQQVQTIRILFPAVCLVCCSVNAILACSPYILSGASPPVPSENITIQVVLFLQTTQVPMLLMVIFEVCYLIHKRRSVNFCGMFFDEGRRVKILSTMFRSWMLRNVIRLLSLTLLCTGIVVNFHWDIKEDDVNDLAGRAGWTALKYEDVVMKKHFALSLFPIGVLTICSFYFTFACWRYGTSSSMVVHSSWMNPWFSPFIGTIALTIGQFFSVTWYPLTSNIGFVSYIISIILLMKEVDKDMLAADDFTDFLKHAGESENISK